MGWESRTAKAHSLMSGSPGGWTQSKANDGQNLGSRWLRDRALIQPGHLQGGVSKDGQVCVRVSLHMCASVRVCVCV